MFFDQTSISTPVIQNFSKPITITGAAIEADPDLAAFAAVSNEADPDLVAFAAASNEADPDLVAFDASGALGTSGAEEPGPAQEAVSATNKMGNRGRIAPRCTSLFRLGPDALAHDPASSRPAARINMRPAPASDQA